MIDQCLDAQESAIAIPEKKIHISNFGVVVFLAACALLAYGFLNLANKPLDSERVMMCKQRGGMPLYGTGENNTAELFCVNSRMLLPMDR